MRPTHSKTLLAAAVLAFEATGAMARSVTANQAGSFIYDQSGAAIGRVKSVDGGRAVLRLGFYNTPGHRHVAVPSSRLDTQGGRVVLNDAGGTTALRPAPGRRRLSLRP